MERLSDLCGWTELTPELVEELSSIKEEGRLVVASTLYGIVSCNGRCGLQKLAEMGGFYFYVLPKLKLE